MSARAQSQVQSSSPLSFTPAPVNLVQRKCACGGSAGLSGKCAECQTEKLVGENAPLVQAKLKISQPNDKYEQEADRVADEVMRMPEPKVQRKVGVEEDEDEETIQTKPIASQITPLIQRQVGSEEEKKQLPLNPRSNGEITPNQESDGKPKSNKEEAKEALKKTGEAFLKTEPGKEIVKKGKEIVSTLPGKVITGTAAIGAVSALIATNKKLPIQAPAIPLDAIHPGLSMKITVEGSLRSPTKAMISFSGKFGIGKLRGRRKPNKTQVEKQREENNIQKRKNFEFRELLKSPEEKARENQRLVDTLTSRLPISGLKSQEEVPSSENEKKEEMPVQRKEASNTTDQSSKVPRLNEAVQSTGHPLDSATRSFMEQRFGHDFGQVKIHVDDIATNSAQSFYARAYTLGQHIFFNQREFKPETKTGRHLIAHELTHTIQQGEGKFPQLVMRAPPTDETDENKRIPPTFAEIYLAISEMEFNTFFDGDLALLDVGQLRTLHSLVDRKIEFFTGLAKQQKANPKFKPPKGVPDFIYKNVVLEYRNFKEDRLDPFVKKEARRQKAPNLFDPWMKQISKEFTSEPIGCAIKNTIDITKKIMSLDLDGVDSFTFSRRGALRLGYLDKAGAQDLLNKALPKGLDVEEIRDKLLKDIADKIIDRKTILPLKLANAFLNLGSGDPAEVSALFTKIRGIDFDIRKAASIIQQQQVGSSLTTSGSGTQPNAVFYWMKKLSNNSENPGSVYSCYEKFLEGRSTLPFLQD